ncbi:phosphatidate cytidylyltransferase [Pseudoxanthomonas broegbernensis]|uniref:Phosphatidate cytidylyltransferase n=1 Tax=Pseudoxanthomonas broegbernensis TaxID=83619 RepID=A0A7V8GMB4_9GAMM|nr:phosphatidate cytidylyltransferase [Pseudoxanthomonas broegbernensis]KAF1686292.1 phosphatidate cytidylyltransferase [Pseudoxanthomonas broegbernensis]MBB6063976.1 phosphatidate cytidylyltransferase [Pseudoxanthomonas broegbernensis]
MTRTRVIAALMMAPAAIAAILLLPTPWMAALAAAVVLAGLWEWLKLAGIDDSLSRTVLLLLTLLLMVLLVWASRGESGFSPALFQIATLAGVLGWALALLWLWRPGVSGNHRSWTRAFKLGAGTLAAVSAWCALCLIHSDNFAALAGGGDPRAHRWLLAALALVWAADSGAYFAGRRWGRRKLAPTISPNKTVEGALGGLTAGLAAAVGFGILAGAGPGQLPALALAAVAAVLASIVGDLVESLLKRQAGVKDSGDLIPGHGGVLDRIDGVLAALPVFAIGKDILGF